MPSMGGDALKESYNAIVVGGGVAALACVGELYARSPTMRVLLVTEEPKLQRAAVSCCLFLDSASYSTCRC